LGQVDSFTVRSTLDTTRRAGAPVMPALLLLEATLDSTVLRVTTRPPLANECDRPEAGAAALAREVLVRVPDGVVVGDQWRDSSVALVCRSGVPITVYTSVQSRLDKATSETLTITRTIASRLEGTGGSAFRALALTGSATGTQRLEVSVARGTMEKLEGTSTLTLQVSERAPPAAARTQQVTQRVELQAERLGR
jgi:hypothetical protein